MMANKNNSNMPTYYQQGDPQVKSNIIAPHQFMTQNERLNSERLLQQNQQTTMGTTVFQPTLYQNDNNNQDQHQQFYSQQLNYNPNMNNQIHQIDLSILQDPISSWEEMVILVQESY
jgi:hypothetical protein